MTTFKPTNKKDFIGTLTKENKKLYITYDGSNRMEYVYEALANTRDGEPCLRTQYVYDGSSSRIIKMEETNSAWDSSYDI